MVASLGSAPDAETVRATIVIIGISVLIFWRYLLRVLIALIVIAVGAGAVMLVQSIHQ
jgi:hypothetical protein